MNINRNLYYVCSFIEWNESGRPLPQGTYKLKTVQILRISIGSWKQSWVLHRNTNLWCPRSSGNPEIHLGYVVAKMAAVTSSRYNIRNEYLLFSPHCQVKILIIWIPALFSDFVPPLSGVINQLLKPPSLIVIQPPCDILVPINIDFPIGLQRCCFITNIFNVKINRNTCLALSLEGNKITYLKRKMLSDP